MFEWGARSRSYTGMAREHPRPPREWPMLAATEEGASGEANASEGGKAIFLDRVIRYLCPAASLKWTFSSASFWAFFPSLHLICKWLSM